MAPAATHQVGDVHETPPRPKEEPSTGKDIVVHCVPSHCSANPAVFPPPTATQNVDEVQETPSNWSPGGSGSVVGTTDQVVPS